VACSAPPSVRTDCIEALIVILIDDSYLQYLWPQLVQISGVTRSKQAVQELVAQYSDNLCREAASALELETSHFVRYHAASIAESIVSTFADRSGNFSAAAIDSAWLGPGETGEQGLLPGHDLDYPSTDVQLVGAFLFQSDAYLRLQASVESYVRAISAL
jgi:hypothetical protein